jgi:uncharacterized protein
MIIIALSDIHSRTRAVTALAGELKSADLVLLCGDITHFGHQREMKDILRLVRDINPSVYAVSGNCDHPDAEQYLVEENISLNSLTREFQGIAFCGLSGSLPCPGKTPNEYSEEEYGVLLDNLVVPSGKPLLMVSHQPPLGTLNDRVPSGQHVGSIAIRNWIERLHPLICFTGHIHEGTGIDHVGITAVVNPGPAGTGGYVRVEIADGVIKNLEVLCSFRG